MRDKRGRGGRWPLEGSQKGEEGRRGGRAGKSPVFCLGRGPGKKGKRKRRKEKAVQNPFERGGKGRVSGLALPPMNIHLPDRGKQKKEKGNPSGLV